jgi:anti-sigma regulatory factor (Ser/Thr protein kinase)
MAAAITARHGNASRPRSAGREAPSAPAERAAPAEPPGPNSLTISGIPKNVARARAFVAEVLGPDHPCADVAVLLCSELVTNAVLHSDSRRPGGTVTIAVADLMDSVEVKVIDEGSASSIPVVKADTLAADGHGLFLVENLAERWGYESDDAGTAVWFLLTP